MALTTIGDRLTPSIPIQITFDAQKLAVGEKVTTLIGHAAQGASAQTGVPIPYVYLVTNIADPAAAKKEVEAIAGQDSEIAKMAYAFVAANALVGRSTFPAFRILILDPADGSVNGDAVELIKGTRSDMIVSPYPANHQATPGLLALVEQISGPDRDLQGQFGSFLTAGSLDDVVTVQGYNFNSQKFIIASLPDTASGDFEIKGDVTQGLNKIFNISEGMDKMAVGQRVQSGSFADGYAIITHIYPSNNVVDVDRVSADTLQNETIQGVSSGAAQPAFIVAAAHAGAMMASTFPYNPLKGVEIGGLVPPSLISDRVEIDPFGSSEALLKAGVSPLYVMPGNKVGFIKTRTTYKLLPDGVTAVTDYNAWQQLVTLNDFREQLYQVCQNPPFNNNPGGTKASLSVANALLGEFVRLALSFEDQGAFQGVKSLVKEFEVQPSPLRRGRFDFKLPVNVLPDLDVVAINVFSTTKFDFTL